MPNVNGLCWVVVISSWEKTCSSTCEIISQVQQNGVRRGHSLLDAIFIRWQSIVGILLKSDSAHLCTLLVLQ